ncbi:MAG: hypothetical protein J5793_05135 [Clostridia bacterium]|nr:hypothetical protein [Clostridia bacterium]
MKTRKILSIVLAVLFVAAAIPAFTGAKTIVVKTYENVALGKSYTCPDCYTGDWAYQVVDGHELTDGQYGYNDCYGTEWVGLVVPSSGNRVHTVIVDLGSEISGLERFNLVTEEEVSASIKLPKAVAYSCSADGTNYTDLGSATIAAGTSAYNCELILDTGVTARYVRALITHPDAAMFCFFCEFEIGVPNGSETIDVPDGEPDNVRFVGTSPLTTDGANCMRGVALGTPVEDLYRQFTGGNNNITIKKESGEARTSGYVATGDYAEKVTDGKVTDTVPIVIDGDVNGDNEVSATDYLMVKRHVLGSYTLTGAHLAAASLTNEGEDPSAVDYLKIKRHVLGTFDLFEKYAFVPYLYDQDMTFTRTGSGEYRMDTTYNGKPYSQTFDKKNEYTEGSSVANWGTWNIGTSYYDGNRLAGGGTDWEYVYRVSNGQGGWLWSGGNHGNEKFLSLQVFDSGTGEEHDLAVGQSFTAKGITLVEKTRMHKGDPNDYYAEVTRTYRLYGTAIMLDVDYHYVKDTAFYMSYTCMFPVYKTYGRHSRIYATDGSWHDNYTTDGTVYEPYGDHYDRGNRSLHVVFWGDSQPTWKYDVEVFTPFDSTDNFSNTSKTMVWDMNQVSDKLYVSKYELTVISDSATLKAGSNVGTRTQWKFFVGDLDD